jgi:hypothetical protein
MQSSFLGFIAYEGKSVIDGKPIVVIINRLYDPLKTSGGSENAKTGQTIQSFIIRSDVPPVEALQTGADVSVCGNCIRRPRLAQLNGEAPCYVNVGRSVRSVYEAYKRGRYTKATPEVIAKALTGQKLRLGTYGDPGACPVSVWQQINRYTSGHIGYSHLWQSVGFDHSAWASLVMASVDSTDEAVLANLHGMRTFRVSIGLDKQVGELICPASAEGGKKTQCADCMLCSGTSKVAKDVVIADHALGHKRRVIQLALAV